MNTQVEISLKDLTEKVNEGWKKQQLVQHYGVSFASMGKILKEAGLRIRKFHKPKYVLVNDLSNTGEDEIIEEETDIFEPIEVVEKEVDTSDNLHQMENNEVETSKW